MAHQDKDLVPQRETELSVSEGSRALVAVVTTARDEVEGRKPVTRPAAAFVAQLIATASDSPQTRNLRRAEPSAAANAYGAKILGAKILGAKTLGAKTPAAQDETERRGPPLSLFF